MKLFAQHIVNIYVYTCFCSYSTVPICTFYFIIVVFVFLQHTAQFTDCFKYIKSCMLTWALRTHA